MAGAYIPANGGPKKNVNPLGMSATGDGAVAGRPGPVGAGDVVFPAAPPFIQVIAIKFLSEHTARMTDRDFVVRGGEAKNPTFVPGGAPFSEWAWKGDPVSGLDESFPVSHTANQRVKIQAKVLLSEVPDLEGTLVGLPHGTDAPKGMAFNGVRQRFVRGVNLVTITSNVPLGKEVRSIPLTVDWRIKGEGLASNSIALGLMSPILAQVVPSRNEVLVTLGEPQSDEGASGITYGRLAHAVQVASAAGSFDPHTIVEKLVLGRDFEPAFSTTDVWALARVPSQGADCITIASYVAAIIKLLGVGGITAAVIVHVRPVAALSWSVLLPAPAAGMPPHTGKGFPVPSAVRQIRLQEDFKGGFKIVEDPAPRDPKLGGLNLPAIFHRSEDWYLRLIDGADGQNNYEGCVKYTDQGGLTKWYPAGTGLSGFAKRDEMMKTVFKSVSWVEQGTRTVKQEVASL